MPNVRCDADENGSRCKYTAVNVVRNRGKEYNLCAGHSVGQNIIRKV